MSLLDDPLRSGAALRQTLVTWLEVDGDIRVAADRRHLHPNTFRYRLRRAAEITVLALDDPAAEVRRTRRPDHLSRRADEALLDRQSR